VTVPSTPITNIEETADITDTEEQFATIAITDEEAPTAEEQAYDYAMSLADRLICVDLIEFFKDLHARCFSEIDVEFMDYFLSLVKLARKFVVPHAKLFEYGVMTSKESSDVRKKMRLLKLRDGVDFLLRDISEQVRSATISEVSGDVSGNSIGRPAKLYLLTPRAFKKCLMRAQRRADQPVDPVKYVDYYLLLETIFSLYRDYQAAYQEKQLSLKDERIESLERKIDKQTAKMDKQSADIAQLLRYGKDTRVDLIETKETLSIIQDDLTETRETLSIVENNLTETMETVEIAKSYLVEKSFASTMNIRFLDLSQILLYSFTFFVTSTRKCTMSWSPSSPRMALRCKTYRISTPLASMTSS
jgi:hypothetical protein